VFREAIQRLEQEGVLMRALEQLPADDELEQREAQGLTLTRPELCVLLAHAKLHMRQWLQSSGVPQDPAMLDLVRAYFPPRALEVVDDGDLEGHRLRSHIASTMLTNRFVDRMGAASHIRLVAETDRAPAIVARTWYVASLISDADDLYGQLESVGSGLRSGALYQAYLDMSDALTRATAWLIHRTSTVEPISGSVEALRGPVREIRAALPGLLSGERLDRFRSHCALHEMDGLDPKTAEALVTFRYLDELLPIASLIRATGSDTAPVGAVYLKLAEEIDFPWLGMGLAALDADDGWSRRSARILSARLEDARLRLAAEILRSRAADDPVERAMERFRHDHAVNLRRIQGVIAEIRSAGSPNLASLLVAVEAIARDAGAVGG
jgi:glutamate dehydrogenase